MAWHKLSTVVGSATDRQRCYAAEDVHSVVCIARRALISGDVHSEQPTPCNSRMARKATLHTVMYSDYWLLRISDESLSRSDIRYAYQYRNMTIYYT